eukprot:CAMPEP_0173272116 /NCGR_PEP_ID=MMETSP1143-20121109/1185_1 /TAXON_ID=483371 /ORGANISM="non described non described, Strain CCMP2298" /LENGTH=38 /DNA_ID= /DNA_START= /DNA_END= /DNA_ORIENTATION=
MARVERHLVQLALLVLLHGVQQAHHLHADLEAAQVAEK